MTETIYRMDTVQKNLLDTFLTGRNQALLFSKGNIDENGKITYSQKYDAFGNEEMWSYSNAWN